MSAIIGQIIENRIFEKIAILVIFHEILNFQDMADLLAECVPKCDLRIEIASTESQDTLKYFG